MLPLSPDLGVRFGTCMRNLLLDPLSVNARAHLAELFLRLRAASKAPQTASEAACAPQLHVPLGAGHRLIPQTTRSKSFRDLKLSQHVVHSSAIDSRAYR